MLAKDKIEYIKDCLEKDLAKFPNSDVKKFVTYEWNRYNMRIKEDMYLNFLLWETYKNNIEKFQKEEQTEFFRKLRLWHKAESDKSSIVCVIEMVRIYVMANPSESGNDFDDMIKFWYDVYCKNYAIRNAVTRFLEKKCEGYSNFEKVVKKNFLHGKLSENEDLDDDNESVNCYVDGESWDDDKDYDANYERFLKWCSNISENS